MKHLKILVGPPGSGKSTKAKDLEIEGFVRVNQDSQGRGEYLHIFDMAILEGRNVVVDRMNFNKVQRNRFLEIAKSHEYTTEIVVFHESYETCLNRCLARADHETIKNEKDARSALGTFFSKYERVEDSEADKVTRLWPEGVKDLAVICDLDGTLCHIDHRLHFVKTEGKKDWKSFFLNLDKDTPNDWCSAIINQFERTYPIVFASGRPNNYLESTALWLTDHGFSTEHLYMRHAGDSRHDYIAKEILLDFEILTRFTPLFFIDDRQQVIDLWRRRGFVALQCAKGDF